MENTKHILITIDVEDWFQVENFKPWIPFSSWSSYELRVEKNTHRLLDLFDSYISTRNSEPGTRNPINATFFVLGWLAERLPNLVREIHQRGHEVASHGFIHNLTEQQSDDDLKQDLSDSKKLLEDIIGAPIFGYRAPSFAINNNILNIIEDCGYFYDSSYNSFALHGRYGHVDFSKNDRKGIAIQISKIQNPKSKILYELPISNLQFSIKNQKSKIKNLVLPWGGGGYFRLIPFYLFKFGIQSIFKKENAYVFYMHPWEIDPEQPRVHSASLFYKFRHYVNLSKTATKLSSFMDSFKQHRFITCHEYLQLSESGNEK